MYFSYGYIYGTRIKVVIITERQFGSSAEELQEVRKVRIPLTKATSAIHEIYVVDKMNPLNLNPSSYSESLNTQILHYRHKYN